MSWSRELDEPIETPDGKQLRTLREAVAYLAKTVPKSELKFPFCPAYPMGDLAHSAARRCHLGNSATRALTVTIWHEKGMVSSR